ncbi:transcriptional regulator with XRE-family HTH domain [Saccharothrix tamanrassetensis]|uniref:Transcriptional regulator with XRE-family HTH domain n=1 Tax=Saccharothrix tamanrassetensis TaxID=1051531 RepID=A0A841C752_9PSEU|nr:helix-turn-helix domain-containing protein [Saccharothrix tamanrassetensis]MBB5954342.1 transcriptional regulator with XRE-family HTH domain [Saccharothrix tamanrassetensis]
MLDGDNGRRELAQFLRSRRERINPAQVGLPVGPRRRTAGLRREEVAVLAGLSPTWYSYLEQGRKIRPSSEVLDSLARVLLLSEDERRYMHLLAHGQVAELHPLETEFPPEEIVQQLVQVSGSGPYPVYALNLSGDVIAWNRPATRWYADFGAMPAHDRNMVRWMFTAPAARVRFADWEADARDIVARLRTVPARRPQDARLAQLIADMHRQSAEFSTWWSAHDVTEQRSRLRTLRHPDSGAPHTMRLVVVYPSDTASFMVAYHLPATPNDVL